jgi:hypothetical protein
MIDDPRMIGLLASTIVPREEKKNLVQLFWGPR